MSFESEFKKCNIDLDEVKEANEFIDKLQEVIDKFAEHGYYGNLEVILNENLIQVNEKYHDVKTILGCKVSYEQLEENISFIVKPCTENTIKSADEMFEELGYERVRENNDSFEIRFVKKFNIKRPRHIIFSVLDKEISVCEENEKELAVKRDYFSMEELKAINKKVVELGWIGKEN